MGKSRLVAELFAYIDARPDLVTWRQGRCLPYGEGISFWALGEIVKAHAGILESDPVDVATTKLEAVLPGGDERPWFRERLLPLLGIEVASSAAQEELFTAWRRFLEHLAGERPTVLVFEDLHWADPGLIAFLEHLADRSEGVPLLLVGTARPELFERHPQFAGNRITLSPLSITETGRLVTALLGAVVPPELSAPILERAEGNPLYAEEFVRLLRDRDLLAEADGAVALRPGATVPLPDSIGALLAARLDTLPPERKSMLADAAVVGKVFWAGAVATMGEREPVLVTDALRELSRKELVRPARHSSIEGEAEYVFWHVLARDVAYNALPRASRAARHVAAARWIESRAGERVEDLADVLAYHYGTALELVRAAGATDLEPELEAAALRFLTLAGRKVMHLDPASAVATFERALALTPPGHKARPELLASFAQAALEIGQYAEAGAALDEATASFRARGDLLAAARAMFTHFGVLQMLDDPRTWTIMPEAQALLEPLPPSAELVDVIARIAGNEVLQGRPESALPMVERALAIAEQLGIVNRSLPLRVRGLARVSLGDEAGVEDLRDAIPMAIDAGGRGVPAAYADLGICLSWTEGPRACLEALREGIAFATARGLTRGLGFLTASTIAPLYDIGEIDEALEVAGGLARRMDASQDVTGALGVRALEAVILAFRDDREQAVERIAPLEAAARQSGHLGLILTFLSSAAIVRAALGDSAAARDLLTDVERYPAARESPEYQFVLPSMIRAAVSGGDRGLAERLVAGIEPQSRQAEHALVTAGAAIAEARGDLEQAVATYADAADRWRRFGVVPEEAFALLGQGRCLLALGRQDEAALVLRQARGIFERLGAAPALAETDALLATTG
jgi:tetratricopeptide (TPR) repeat protein